MGTADRYEFEFVGGNYNLYRFSTVAEVRYEVKFVPSTDFFDAYPGLGAEVFEMIISVVDNPRGGRLPADARTSLTVFAIFEHFFLPQRHALVFICDSSDGREGARYRKFSVWFYSQTASTNDLAKFDRNVLDGDRIIHLSLILSRKHPQLGRIVEVFMQLGEEDK